MTNFDTLKESIVSYSHDIKNLYQEAANRWNGEWSQAFYQGQLHALGVVLNLIKSEEEKNGKQIV